MLPDFDPRSCEHQTRLVFRPYQNGNPRFQHQCTKCGSPVGNWIAVAEVKKLLPLNQIPTFDSALHKRMEKLKLQLNSDERTQRQGWYREYLQSDIWRIKREAVLERSGYVCEGCLKAKATEVHHLSYENAGREFLWELVAVCREYHERAHGLNPPPVWLDDRSEI